MGRHELSDKQWSLISDLFPENIRKEGRPWEAHRRIFNGISWILHTGAPWRDAPQRYGPWQTLHSRFTRWRRDGTLDRVVARLQKHLDELDEIDWKLFSVDGSSIRASRAAAGAKKKALSKVSRKTTRSVGPEVGGARRSI
jgi:transposase